MSNSSSARKWVLPAVLLAVLVLAGSALRAGAADPRPLSPRVIQASIFAKVAPTYPGSDFGDISLLEGPAFGPDGALYLVSLNASAGQPKVLRLDTGTKEVGSLYTDDRSEFSSLQFSPRDGKIYLTDLASGVVDRMNPDGTGFTTVFAGPVDGRVLKPDDLAFDPDGAMFITDMTGTPWNPTGRIVRLDADATHATVLLNGLATPNGISFTPDYTGLWVSEYKANREDHLVLAADRESVSSGTIGMYANNGPQGLDSNAVDAAGNVYQCVYQGGEVLVWNHDGEQIATIELADGLPKPQEGTTNLAIQPGTTHGFLVVGGENGGYVYRFDALARGIGPSNGGGAAFG
ncbi:SMP-30/gluconolactonase/LRE family protein [Amycolatopsis acidicola]|uniref:SMP-30/gluconolactonase/LRE family protein n=1 Tax=Amycolatopsis acidicola TaxID=2596893 RepID=A0A5N0VA78_9PSEU|nr:SMP-30/gluconolactonase/LRE family protein [Amycolatopsis acidicola]KAA9163289.1 SMP-30/gluconolactonase/LRE family protein [Amycolatopsis acidicola]